MRIPGFAIILMGWAGGTLSFPKLRRADPHPLGLSDSALRPTLVVEDNWDGMNLIDITLSYGDPLDLSAPLVAVTTSLPDKMWFTPLSPGKALARLVQLDEAIERHDVRRMGFDDELESEPYGTVILNGTQVMVSSEPYQIQVLSYLHYQAAQFVHDSAMTTITARHHSLGGLELGPIPSIDPYLAGHTAFVRRVAQHGWHI
jgi:hypothetical protein